MQFKKGDRVRILRKAKTHERGWKNSWEPDLMDAAVGKIGYVQCDEVADTQDVYVAVRGMDTWGYPNFVLQKVRPTAVKKTSRERK